MGIATGWLTLEEDDAALQRATSTAIAGLLAADRLLKVLSRDSQLASAKGALGAALKVSAFASLVLAAVRALAGRGHYQVAAMAAVALLTYTYASCASIATKRGATALERCAVCSRAIGGDESEVRMGRGASAHKACLIPGTCASADPTRCTVCKERIAPKSMVFAFPCGHLAHKPCTAPIVSDAIGTCECCSLPIRPDGSGRRLILHLPCGQLYHWACIDENTTHAETIEICPARPNKGVP